MRLMYATPAWHSGAKCANSSPDQFVTGDSDQIARAKLFCQDCPVRLDCLQHAIEVGELGVWGGTDERERRQMVVAS